DRAVVGSSRFLNRLWQKVTEEAARLRNLPGIKIETPRLSEEARGLYRATHLTIKKVSEDIETSWHFNTAIASVMELFNQVEKFRPRVSVSEASLTEDILSLQVLRHSLESITLLLAPFVPHICEELWQSLGNKPSLFEQPRPIYDPEAIKVGEIELVVQVNGKVRGHLVVPVDLQEEEIKVRALEDENVKKFLDGKKVVNIILVPKKLVNIVVG
ncbi:MAG: class I tRNA ligase family protein, partial [Planctomycetota bacterium]